MVRNNAVCYTDVSHMRYEFQDQKKWRTKCRDHVIGRVVWGCGKLRKHGLVCSRAKSRSVRVPRVHANETLWHDIGCYDNQFMAAWSFLRLLGSAERRKSQLEMDFTAVGLWVKTGANWKQSILRVFVFSFHTFYLILVRITFLFYISSPPRETRRDEREYRWIENEMNSGR